MDRGTLRKQLEKEGFPYIYEWHDEPGVVYEPHAHKGNVVLFIISGSLVFTIDGADQEYTAGDRYDVPPGVTHAAVVGPLGCDFLVGEMIEGDS